MQPCSAVAELEHLVASASPSAGILDSGVLSDAESLEAIGINRLRREIRSNRVTFPAQVPVFVKHDRPDLQRKVVQLYFLSGWSTYRIASRYSMTAQRVHQVINTWKQRAVQMGYIQEIPDSQPPVRPVDASPIQVFLTQVLDTRSVCRPQDSPSLEVIEHPAEEANSGLNIEHRESKVAQREHEGNPIMLAGGDDEVTLLRTENKLLKELLRGLMAKKDAPPIGTFVEEAHQYAEA
jgi:hypothetical protein